MVTADPLTHGHAATLLPRHLADLAGSGLTVDDAVAAGLYSEDDPAAVARLLRWKHPAQSLGSCLCFPFRGPDGSVEYVRVKPDRPRLERGKAVRYESPAGVSNRAFFPPGVREALADAGGAEVVVVEGEKKALCGHKHGFVCVGLVGVYGWQRKRRRGEDGKPTGPRELIPDLAAVAWAGRRVYIVFDSDLAEKPEVGWAEYHLAEALTAAGADVRVVRLPPGSGGAKQGLDDFLVASGPDALRALLVAARAPEWPKPAGSSYPTPEFGEAWDDPHRLARLFLDERRSEAGEPLLRQWRGEWHRWDGTAWVPVADPDLDAEIARHCRAVFVADLPARRAALERMVDAYPVTTSVRANVRLNLVGLANLPDDSGDPPFWVGGGGGRPDPAEVLAAPNGLFTLEAIAAGAGPFAPPTPAFFTPNALPFPVPKNAPRPETWLQCLGEWFGGDQASIDGLQEVFGYALSADTSAHKVFLLVGPPRSGKGTILHVLTRLSGAANVASTSFAALGSPFGLQGLLGKRLAVIPDARVSGRLDAGAVVERLLSVSGEDAQYIDRKHKTPVTTKLGVRFVIATNELPRLPDASGAVASRFLIFHTPNSWLGKEDRGLKAKLAAELPGILLWAAAGWVRLRGRGMEFTLNEAAAKYHRELADLSSPIKAFLSECCRVGPGREVEIPELFQAWRAWNADRNQGVGSEQVFGRDLHAALPQVRTSQPRRDGRRLRVYVGVGLRDRDEWGEDKPPARGGTRDNPLHASGEEGEEDEQEGRIADKGCNSPDRVPVRATGPDPSLATTWCGTRPNGRPDPGGDLPPGGLLPPHATYWKQPGSDWTPVKEEDARP